MRPPNRGSGSGSVSDSSWVFVLMQCLQSSRPARFRAHFTTGYWASCRFLLAATTSLRKHEVHLEAEEPVADVVRSLDVLAAADDVIDRRLDPRRPGEDRVAHAKRHGPALAGRLVPVRGDDADVADAVL